MEKWSVKCGKVGGRRGCGRNETGLNVSMGGVADAEGL